MLYFELDRTNLSSLSRQLLTSASHRADSQPPAVCDMATPAKLPPASEAAAMAAAATSAAAETAAAAAAAATDSAAAAVVAAADDAATSSAVADSATVDAQGTKRGREEDTADTGDAVAAKKQQVSPGTAGKKIARRELTLLGVREEEAHLGSLPALPMPPSPPGMPPICVLTSCCSARFSWPAVLRIVVAHGFGRMAVTPAAAAAVPAATAAVVPEASKSVTICASNNKVGSVIGRAGMVIRQIRTDSGAHVNIGDPVPGADRVVSLCDLVRCTRLSRGWSRWVVLLWPQWRRPHVEPGAMLSVMAPLVLVAVVDGMPDACGWDGGSDLWHVVWPRSPSQGLPLVWTRRW